MAVGETAEMPVRIAPDAVMPVGTGGSGVGTTDQAVPFQCSTSALLPPLTWERPTAHASVGLSDTTPSRTDFDEPLVAGVGTIVQSVPSQCTASVSPMTCRTFLVKPTNHASSPELALTAGSPPSVGGLAA